MTEERGVGKWERMRFRALKLGPRDLLRRAIHKAGRQAIRQWRRTRAYLINTRADRPELARALHVRKEGLTDELARVRKAMRTRLPTGPDDGKAIGETLNRYAPEVIASQIGAADRICYHVFDLLGSGPVPLGTKIDWHRDYKSGYRWDPRLFYTDVPLEHQPGADIKVPWELSRGQHLVLLAQTYLLTGNERYAREVVGQIKDWLVENPPQFGVNWACGMDVAIRAVNWLWATCLVADSPEVDEEFLCDLLAGFLVHGRHLMANLEIWPNGITTNHYLANIIGLLYLGLCLPELEEAASWRDFASCALNQEMDRQVLPDGANYESSIPYHRLVAEMFLSAALLCRHHGASLPPTFWTRLVRMVEFVQAYTKPNGLAPQLGDADDGRLHILSGYGSTDPRDHRHLLALGALLFEREGWWAAAGPSWIEALWFGGHGYERWNCPPAEPPPSLESVAFSDAGLYIIRAQNDYLLFNCGPVGTQGVGNHKHNDLLSLEVHLGGEDILVDPGSFLYTSDPEARNAFRGTAAHSTVMLDGLEQNRFVPKQLFCLHPDAHPQVLAWKTEQGRDYVVAEHDGYCRLANSVVHRRAVTFDRSIRQIEVLDQFENPAGYSRTHELMWTFSFAPGYVVEPITNGWMVRTARQRVQLSLPCRHPAGDILQVDTAIEQGWVSPRYGVREKAPILRWRWRGAIPLTMRFILSCN